MLTDQQLDRVSYGISKLKDAVATLATIDASLACELKADNKYTFRGPFNLSAKDCRHGIQIREIEKDTIDFIVGEVQKDFPNIKVEVQKLYDLNKQRSSFDAKAIHDYIYILYKDSDTINLKEIEDKVVDILPDTRGDTYVWETARKPEQLDWSGKRALKFKAQFYSEDRAASINAFVKFTKIVLQGDPAKLVKGPELTSRNVIAPAKNVYSDEFIESIEIFKNRRFKVTFRDEATASRIATSLVALNQNRYGETIRR
jgi:hypothetical protein